MKIWFTSDTHFGSKRTLDLSKRPFKTVKEMDKALINNWNKNIAKNDIVFHLGDFGNYEIDDLRQNYKKVTEFKQKMINTGFYKVSIFRESLKIGREIYYLHHKPSDALKYKKLYGAKQLFGHIHKLQMIKPYGLNVGIDCHNFTPIDLDMVNFYLNAIENHYDEEVFLFY